MSFKKISIKKNNNKNKNILNIVWISSIFIVFLFSIYISNSIKDIEIDIDKDNILVGTSKEKNENIDEVILSENNEKKEDDGTVNILLVWRWWWDHDAPELTDTIIVAKINKDKKIVSMLSIPRDLYVEYPLWVNKDYKINSIYSYFYNINSSESYWISALKKKIKEITGEDIDYYINVDFNGFIDIIDTLWWIQLTLEENFVDEQYPDWNWWYKTLIFKKWTWLFDWDSALKYVRSRHSTSDFDRSMRQQQVIQAIKNKIISSDMIKSPSKIKRLYEVMSENISTDLSLSEIVKIIYDLRLDKDDYKILSSNMNDSCFYGSDTCSKWWILYIPLRENYEWMSVLLVNWTEKWNLWNYKLSKKYSDIVLNNLDFQLENFKINIFNSTKVNNLAWALSNDIIRYWFHIPAYNSIWNTPEIYENSIILFNNIDEDSNTIKLLKTFFKWEIKKVDYPLFSQDWANIEIIIWTDYIQNNKIFNF